MSFRRSGHLALALLLTVACGSATTITSTFNTDVDGWTASNNATTSWQNVGGNPGGFLEETDTGNGNMHVVAPSKFLIDLSSGAFTLSTDLMALATPGSAVSAFGTINFISTTNGTLTYTALVPTIPTSWTNYSVALTAANFGNNASFAAIMSSLTSITMVLEADKNSNSESVGVDNFTISDNAQADVTIPEPGTVTLIATGLVLALVSRIRKT